jgi:signal transduction histidine kinase
MGQLSAFALLQFLANVLYVVVFLVTAVRAARHRRRADLDVALLFGATAVIIAVSWVADPLGIAPIPLLMALSGALIMTLPYLLLRLVDDFSVVPLPVMRLAAVGAIAAVISVFVAPQPYPLALVGLLVAYFVVLAAYDASAFVRAAGRSRGVTRRRMQAVAIGTLFLGLDVLAAGLGAALPGWAPLAALGSEVFGLASGVAYVCGFASPGALRRAWQAPELRRALRRWTALIRVPDDDALIAELERSCAETVGAPRAAIGLWDDADGTLRFRIDGKRLAYPPGRLVAGRVLATQRPLFTADLTSENQALAAEHARYQARAALIAPISAGPRRFGVVVVSAPRAPIFAEDDLDLLQVLADQMAVILENRALVDETARARARAEALAIAEAERRRANTDLEARVSERTVELRQALEELESFSYSVSHDLRAPLRTIDGFVQAFLEDYGAQLDEVGRDYLERARGASQRMGELIDGLLRLSRVTRSELVPQRVDLSALARDIVADLRRAEPGRSVAIDIAEGMAADGDAQLLRAALENLLGNAWKFTARTPDARISFTAHAQDGQTVYIVRDNGAGFDMTYADKLFGPFQRLHREDEFDGTGIGLATVQRIIHRHGGWIRGDGEVGRGAAFSFTLSPTRSPPTTIMTEATLDTEDAGGGWDGDARSVARSGDLVGRG